MMAPTTPHNVAIPLWAYVAMGGGRDDIESWIRRHIDANYRSRYLDGLYGPVNEGKPWHRTS
jgi:hypothetical protein